MAKKKKKKADKPYKWDRNYNYWFNLDFYFAEVIVHGLKHFRKNLHGHPVSVKEDTDVCHWIAGDVPFPWNADHPSRLSFEDWEAILDEMIEGFECYNSGNEDEETQKKIRRAIDLFAKHFYDLWD